MGRQFEGFGRLTRRGPAATRNLAILRVFVVKVPARRSPPSRAVAIERAAELADQRGNLPGSVASYHWRDAKTGWRFKGSVPERRTKGIRFRRDRSKPDPLFWGGWIYRQPQNESVPFCLKTFV
jgi:hypothetical protein